MIELNSKVENFTLMGIDTNGQEKEYNLFDFLGQNLVIYFYPKDNTPGCTTEACDFRDKINRIKSKAFVLGISPDKLITHKIFKTKNNLNFPLLSDPEHKVLEMFGAWGEKQMYGKIFIGVIRSTFLIDKKGILKKSWSDVKVKGHVSEVLESIKKL